MPTAQRNSLRLLRWMMAAALALPLALFAFASAMSRISINEAADQEIQRTLDVAHEHALKVFETIDRSLAEVAEALPQVKSIWVFDANGRALVNSLVQPVPDIDFSDREYFRIHAPGDIGTYIGEVLTPRPPYLGSRFFSVGRRRNNEDGSFAGVIQASVLPEYFVNFYARIGREPGSFLALIRTDGAVLAHFPVVDRNVRFEPGGPLGRQIVANPEAGAMTIQSPADGVERRMRYQRLAEYPIYVSAGLETSAIQSRWMSTMAQHLIFGIPATALLFGLLALAFRRTQRLQEEANRRIEAEDALRHGQRLEALGQLTGGVAHDFNNLLTVIRASVDMLRRPDLPEPRRQRYIDAISNTVNRAAKLTNQLLAFARRQTLKPEVFDASQNVRTLSEMIATLIGSRIEITAQVPDETCLVNADAGQFETAIINMAVNARDAMDGVGRLTIAVRPVNSLPSGAANPPSPHGHVAVSVADTGVGIPQDLFGRIFEPFYTTKEIGQGTGLGLSQVFGFAKQSGGEVTVTSDVGKGSTFTLYLPRVVGEHRPQSLRTEDAPSVDRTAASVLIVEDNVEVGKFAADTLTQLGCTCVLVENATHALEELAVDPDRFDLVFTDVVMPGMSGIELAGEIRRQGLDLPIVLASGYSQVLSQQGSGGFELLQKPYSAEQLARVLHKAARSRRLRRDQAPAS